MIKKLLDNPPFVISVIILLIFISIPFQIKIDINRDKFGSIKDTLLVNSSILKNVSLGFDELLSDIYWFRALQYFGSDEIRMFKKDPELLYNYLDLITDLDPKFVNAYRFGGTFLAEPLPIGLGDLDKGLKLLDKGRNNNPENFRLPYEQAFLNYLYTKDYLRASELFNEASEKEGLSEFRKASIKGMAALAGARGNDRELSKMIWEDIYNNTTNEGRKKFALNNLKELQTQDFEDKLSALAEKYNEQNGKYPSSINDLLLNGYIKKIPKDHGGADFFVTKNLKGLKSTTLSKRILDDNIAFLNARVRRFKNDNERNPETLYELREYIEAYSYSEYPLHPLGEEYIYNPETGKVDYDRWFLE